MKNTNFLLMVVMSILMVAAVSCTTMQGAADDNFDRTTQNGPSRLYVDDPYYYGRTIVLERDPVTGRYYQLNGFSNGFLMYDNRFYNDRFYGNRYPSRVVTQPRQNTSGRGATEQQRSEAREKILGKRN